MRHLYLSALLMALTSCTVLKPEGTWVQGSIWLVPQADIRSAIAVASSRSGYPPEAVERVIVSSRSELSIYFYTPIIEHNLNYKLRVVLRKENGQWRYISDGFA